MADILAAGVLVISLAILVLMVLTWRLQATPSVPSVMGGAPEGFELVSERLDDLSLTLTALHEAVMRRPAGSLPLGTERPKDHRPQFVPTSVERNNKVVRYICTCRVEDCPDTLILEQPELPALPGVPFPGSQD